MNITKLSRNPRAMRALTGLSYEEFSDLVPAFGQTIVALKMEEPNRQRKVGGGQKGKLKTVEQKLFFTLFYLKTYPTFDVLACFFDRGRGRSCESIHFFTQALEKALGRKLVLPKRKISSMEEFMEAFPEVKDVFLDGTERRVEKPKKKKKQNKLYSGKKKGTTRKNIVVADERKRVLVLTPTKSGRRHDKRLADKVLLAEHIPKEVAAWTDTGFKGIERVHGNTVMPHKATKKNPLTVEQKQENKLISSFRVVAEHAIGGIKRLRSVSDVYRNKKANLDDRFMLLAAGLWNLHLQQTA